MTQTKQIDTSVIADAIKSLSEHMVDMAPVLLAISEQSIESWPIIDGALVVEPVWHADDGNAEITGEFSSGEDAAQDYVDGGDWGEITETTWIDVAVWREGIDTDGDVVRVDEQTHTITIDPTEPKCTESEHDWQSPVKIVGGCKENPGVYSHGGGVTMQEVCVRCGCGRLTDTWAQDPETGQQGLDSVTYQPGKYAAAVTATEEEE